MTLSINKRFVREDVTVTVSLPSHYDGQRPYPAVFLNDGQLSYLSSLSESVILVGLRSKNRLDDYTPWKASALRAGRPDFGGRADSYHQEVFGSIMAELKKEYRLDESRIAYGGYSLGGLAAVYSLYSGWKMPCVFSICGSFWYPEFTDYCRTQELKNRDCLIYLRNGKTEGANHTNRLFKAPLYAAEIHSLIQKELPAACSVFDPYGHHDALKERYAAFADWLAEQWHIN
ncbi:alpha/beta hydrolase-fold protein [Streptococcus panodentis]|uniref:Alpha/beta hydrolase n=1 Tax=Streptococcus panodentis TaxID=1581472 RepID=A0ABS5AYP3_9STRE|nr:alpha/beta hydrolase-fold protein [Streptococcus panodentis]MBP2621691.1 alpha/beta hydrolase [Streptococcus panodentis]